MHTKDDGTPITGHYGLQGREPVSGVQTTKFNDNTGA